MFLGYGVCYSASVFFESMRNLESVKIVNIALTETASNAYMHMLSLGPEFFFQTSQRHRIFNLYKVINILSIFRHNRQSNRISNPSLSTSFLSHWISL
jgi:hypothetical protein